MLNRQITDFGLHPIVGYFLSLAAFIGLSIYLFLRTEYATYIYIPAAISFILRLSETNRNRFLKTCFTNYNYYKIRLAENTLVVLPFMAFLVYQMSFLPAVLLLIASFGTVGFNFNSKINFTIPTPFYKKPFEFIVGFRNTYYVLIFSYFLTIMAISVRNFNLGIFSLIVVLLICLSYYSTLEARIYVWIFSLSSKKFLLHKIKAGSLFFTILSVPIIAALSIFFPDKFFIIVGFHCLGYVYLATVVLAKYSAFPHQISLPQVLLIVFSVSFPPFLLAATPYFYLQSVKRLNQILE